MVSLPVLINLGVKVVWADVANDGADHWYCVLGRVISRLGVSLVVECGSHEGLFDEFAYFVEKGSLPHEWGT